MAKWRQTAWSLLGFVLFLTAPLSGAVAQSIEFFGSIYDLDPPVFESSGLEQLVGDDDTTPLNQFHPQDLYRQLARPVGRLAVEFKSGKSAYCTAALVSDDLILTNAHCIFDASGNNLVRAGVLSMGYLSAGVKEGTDQYEVATSSPIEFGTPGPEGAPDYVILRVKSGEPGKTWGTVQLSHDSPLDGGSLAIMHHPRGFPMVVSAGGKCRSTRLSPNDVFHICDTQGGVQWRAGLRLGIIQGGRDTLPESRAIGKRSPAYGSLARCISRTQRNSSRLWCCANPPAGHGYGSRRRRGYNNHSRQFPKGLGRIQQGRLCGRTA